MSLLCVDLIFNKEEHPNAAILLKSAPHLPGQYDLIAHVFVDFRTGLQNRLGHRREVAVEEVGVAVRVHLVCQRSGSLQVQKHEYAKLPTRVVVATDYVPQEHAGPKQPVELYKEEKESDNSECFNHPDKGLMPEEDLEISPPRNPINEHVQEIEHSKRQVHDHYEYQ